MQYENAVHDLEHRLADLYIDLNADRDLRGEGFDSWYSYHNTNIWFYNNQAYYNSVGTRSYITDSHPVFELRHKLYGMRDRFYNWREWRETAKRNARRRLDEKFHSWAYSPNQRLYMRGEVKPMMEANRKRNELVKAAIKQHGNFLSMDAEPTPQNHNAAFELFMALRDTGYVPQKIMAKPLMAQIHTQLSSNHAKFFNGEWRYTVWENQAWYYNSMYYPTHQVHVSTTNPEHVAYTQSGDKLMRDIQTSVKPARYLMKYFGPESDNPVLTEAQCREWGQKQVEAAKPLTLHLVPNTDSDGWEWVYEHAEGFTSCMMYNRSDRYLNCGCYGENHPVRMYACKHNDLALAYIGDDWKTKPDGKVYARAIVNTKTKKYVRIYGDDRIKNTLIANGYEYDSSCLGGQVLTRKEYNGSWLMPYLDGYYTNVRFGDTFGGEEVWVIGDDGQDAQNSSGLMDYEELTCPCCGDAVDDEDDLTYVECRGESICQSCLDEHYVYATGRRGNQDYYDRDDCVQCESDDEWYVECYANDNGVYRCEYTDNWYNIDDLVGCTAGSYDGQFIHIDYAKELPNGEWCHEDDYDELLEELEAADDESDDEEDSQPVTTTMTRPRTQPVERITMNTFKPGDKVMIVRKQGDHKNGWRNSWAEGMDEFVNDGKVYTVRLVVDHGVYVDESWYGFPWKSLMFAEDAKHTEPHVVPGYVVDVALPTELTQAA